MSREDLHFRLRIPADIKAKIEKAAQSNRRSVTAEIVNRLSADSEDLRDGFAMAAIKGLLTADVNFLVKPDEAADRAYVIADAMISRRRTT